MSTPYPEHFKKVVAQEAAYLRLVHPTVEDLPSCISLLDNYWECARVKNQIKQVYRYGERSNCGPKLEDYKFCMSLKFMDDEKKYDTWIQRRAVWWAKRRIGRSSEDVWEMRDTPLVGYPRPITESQPLEEKIAMW